MIVAAAIRVGELVLMVPRPGRHHSVIHAVAEATTFRPARRILMDGEQGFLTDEGEFLTREQALCHAVKFNQVKLRRGRPVLLGGGVLTSEDLW